MLTAVGIHIELVHFIITSLISSSHFDWLARLCVLCFCTEMNWIMVYVVAEKKYCGVHFVSMWQKKKKTRRHDGVPEHNAQSGERLPYFVLLIVYLTVCVQSTVNKTYSPPLLSHDCLTPSCFIRLSPKLLFVQISCCL